MSTKIHCSVSYHELPIDSLDEFATGVRDGIYITSPLVFVGPPKTQAQFEAIINTYISKRQAYKDGGVAQKPAFIAAKAALIAALDEATDFVDPIANGDAATIALSGFHPTDGTAHFIPAPDIPTGGTLKRPASGGAGVIDATCDKMPRAVDYGCICLTASLTSNQIGIVNGLLSIQGYNGNVYLDLNKNRDKTFSNLIPGTIYYFYWYCKNANGVTALTAPQSMMAAS